MLAIFSLALAEEMSYDTASQRDPFVPLIGPGAMRSDAGRDAFAVEGIIFDPNGGSYAVIAGEIYREGEEISGSKVVKIMPDRVVFLQKKKELVIWLREEIVRREDAKSDEKEGEETNE